MNRLFPLLIVGALGFFSLLRAAGQDSFAGIDLLYPELAHPDKDAQEAIERRDFRFVAIDPYGKDVPGMEHHLVMERRYGTKLVWHPFRIVASPSQNFSFKIRARAYATEYNRILLRHLLGKE
jgi:hypothetical protein